MTVISNAVMAGVTDFDCQTPGSYIKRVRVGTGTPSYATVNGTGYFAGALEAVGRFYPRGGISLIGAQQFVMTDATAAAVNFNVAGVTYLQINTDSAAVQVSKMFKYTPNSGVYCGDESRNSDGATYQADYLSYSIKSAAGSGGLISLKNPYNARCIIEAAFPNIKSPSSGTSNTRFDLGVTSLSNMKSDTLIDNGNCSATGVVDNINSAGTNGRTFRTWAASEFVTMTTVSGNSAPALSGELILKCKRLE